MAYFGMPIEASGANQYMVDITPTSSIETVVEKLRANYEWITNASRAQVPITITEINTSGSGHNKPLELGTLVSNGSEAAVYKLMYAENGKNAGVVLRIQRKPLSVDQTSGQYGTDATLQYVECKAVSIASFFNGRIQIQEEMDGTIKSFEKKKNNADKETFYEGLDDFFCDFLLCVFKNKLSVKDLGPLNVMYKFRDGKYSFRVIDVGTIKDISTASLVVDPGYVMSENVTPDAGLIMGASQNGQGEKIWDLFLTFYGCFFTIRPEGGKIAQEWEQSVARIRQWLRLYTGTKSRTIENMYENLKTAVQLIQRNGQIRRKQNIFTLQESPQRPNRPQLIDRAAVKGYKLFY